MHAGVFLLLFQFQSGPDYWISVHMLRKGPMLLITLFLLSLQLPPHLPLLFLLLLLLLETLFHYLAQAVLKLGMWFKLALNHIPPDSASQVLGLGHAPFITLNLFLCHPLLGGIQFVIPCLSHPRAGIWLDCIVIFLNNLPKAGCVPCKNG